jgi:hypothetical protein
MTPEQFSDELAAAAPGQAIAYHCGSCGFHTEAEQAIAEAARAAYIAGAVELVQCRQGDKISYVAIVRRQKRPPQIFGDWENLSAKQSELR